jgi:hypothetical protein
MRIIYTMNLSKKHREYTMKDSSILDEYIGNASPSQESNAPPEDSLLDITHLGESAEGEVLPITLSEGEIDPRLKLLSHSSRTTLHRCPRKYQLYRLASSRIALETEAEVEQGVTFAYGTAVGVGVASALEGKSEEQCILDTFLAWDVDFADEDKLRKKSIYLAIFAIQRFTALRESGYLSDYELAYYKGKPAVELSFQVMLPDGFIYRGFVDAVLMHKTTKQIMVLENKTSSGTANAAMFKNSGQALGYSVVLDILFPTLSAYTVLYLVYETKTYEYKELPFEKSLLQRALWLQELLIDTQEIELYESYGVYPLRGESCYDFFKPCEYLGLCNMQTSTLAKPLTQNILDDIEEDQKRYEFKVSFEELIESQLAKGEQ